MTYNDKIIFVVGYSRSGTKMMSDLLEKSNVVLRPPEIHFFGTIINPERENDKLINISSTLDKISSIQKKGLNFAYPLSNENKIKLIEKYFNKKDVALPVEIYLAYFNFFKLQSDKEFFCDATPRNIYYIDFLLKSFPNAKFIYMLRDPRENVFSQKYKYKKIY
jgi:omega-hydroxy-beta-dihydromenaquinone-9 sulfotransferase